MSRFINKVCFKNHFPRNRSAPNPDDTFKCKHRFEVFPVFDASQHHENIRHGGTTFKRTTADVDPDDIINKIGEKNLEEEVCMYQYFPVDFEIERQDKKYWITQ